MQRTSCGSSGTRSTSWQSKAMPISRGARPVGVQPRDGAVVVAGAIADAVAARVEGGERHQHQRRDRARRASGRARACRTPCRPIGAPRTSSRKTIVVLSRMAGRQSRAPLSRSAQHQRAHIDLGADRPEAGDDCAGHRRRDRDGRRRQPCRCDGSSASRASVGSSASRLGQRRALRSCFFKSFERRGHGAGD